MSRACLKQGTRYGMTIAVSACFRSDASPPPGIYVAFPTTYNARPR